MKEGFLMWILYAVLSSFFAGLTSILAKIGINKTDSTVATAIRTIVVVIFSWIMVLVVGSINTISNIETKSLVFLILSGLATGASWLCYFRAIQIGDINKVVPIDKSSTIITIILAFIFLDEAISQLKIFAIILIAVGTFLMIDMKNFIFFSKDSTNAWFIYALLSAIFAALTAILGKIGIENIESNLGTAIRTVVVLIMSLIMVLVEGKTKEIKEINSKELKFIVLSGFATGGSWLFYYKALQDGLASVVVPIDKLSIVFTIIFSYIIFKEKLNKKTFLGLVLIIAGTLLMLV